MSTPAGRGLIVGKFYPPHAGHHALIDWASERCTQLTVVVMAAAGESLSLASRVEWLRATHADNPGIAVVGIPCDAPVDYESPSVWAAQIALIDAAIRQVTATPMEVVFSSEPYGDELAARMGARHEAFDPDRRQVPISGSRVRDDLPGCWDLLAPATRAGLAARIVIVGAESSGTTTIARELTDYIRSRGGVWRRTKCVPEYGRGYTMVKWEQAQAAALEAGISAPALGELVWTPEDFDGIGREQTRSENLAAEQGSPLLICDTDAFATSVWERRYLGRAARQLQPWAATDLPSHDVYLLTSHEGVPWEDDGLREGDLSVRTEMTAWFADALTAAGHSWVLLTGDHHQRLSLAIEVADYVLAQRLHFSAAITDGRSEAAGVSP